MRAGILLLVFLVSGPSVLNGGEPLTMNVSPQTSFAPANLLVRLTIEPNDANRVVEIVAESNEFYRSSQVALEGDRGPRTVQLQFRNLPGGTYVVHGTVSDSQGHEVASSRHEVTVLGEGKDY